MLGVINRCPPLESTDKANKVGVGYRFGEARQGQHSMFCYSLGYGAPFVNSDFGAIIWERGGKSKVGFQSHRPPCYIAKGEYAWETHVNIKISWAVTSAPEEV